MKKSILSLFLLTFVTTLAVAQNTNNPWLVSVGLTSVSMNGDITYPSEKYLEGCH
jgi:hypothetical protein